MVGRDQRLFAAHEDVLSLSPFFVEALKDQFFVDANGKKVDLPDEYVETLLLLQSRLPNTENPKFSHVSLNTFTRVTTILEWSMTSAETLGDLRTLRKSEKSVAAGLAFRQCDFPILVARCFATP